MRILVTGGTGYLGSEIIQQLKAQGLKAQSVSRGIGADYQCDLLDKSELEKLIHEIQPSHIIHCAAFVPQSLEEYQDKALSSKNLELLGNISTAHKGHLINISSMTVYGRSNKVRRHENDAGNPESAYGISKWEGENFLSHSNRDSFSIRIPGLYGGERQGGLVGNCLKSLKEGRELTLPSESLLWAAMSVDDAAKGIICMLNHKPQGHIPVNLGYEDVYSIKNFLKICEELLNTEIFYTSPQPEFQYDLTRAQKYGIKPAQTLKSSLEKMLREMQ